MGSCDGDCAATEALHSCVKGCRGAGRGFVEYSTEKAALEYIEDSVACHSKDHFLGDGEEIVKILATELAY